MSLEQIERGLVLPLDERVDDVPDVGLLVNEGTEGLVQQKFRLERGSSKGRDGTEGSVDGEF